MRRTESAEITITTDIAGDVVSSHEVRFSQARECILTKQGTWDGNTLTVELTPEETETLQCGRFDVQVRATMNGGAVVVSDVMDAVILDAIC
jgi:hypothetical protein